MEPEGRLERLRAFMEKHDLWTWVHGDPEEDAQACMDGKPEGYETQDMIRTRPDPYQRYFFIADKRPGAYERERPETFVRLGFASHEELWVFLLKSQAEYRKFLDKCVQGDLDLDFLNSIQTEISRRPTRFRPGSDPWLPKAQSSHDSYSLEDNLDSALTMILFGKRGAVFSRIRICRHCRSFFVFERPTKTFCSERCRRDFHNRIMISRRSEQRRSATPHP
jgi:hypothetical protein